MASEYRLDVKDPRLSVPADIQGLLVGRNEIKIYEIDDPVFKWLGTLSDAAANYEDVSHPFLEALKYEVCHDSALGDAYIWAVLHGVTDDDPLAALFAFDDGGMIVGFSVVSTSKTFPSDLIREVTCTGIRRKGWGTKLDQAVLQYARRMGTRHVRLEPTEDAKPIHLAMGFRVDPDRPSFLIKDVPPAGGRRKTRRRKTRKGTGKQIRQMK